MENVVVSGLIYSWTQNLNRLLEGDETVEDRALSWGNTPCTLTTHTQWQAHTQIHTQRKKNCNNDNNNNYYYISMSGILPVECHCPLHRRLCSDTSMC